VKAKKKICDGCQKERFIWKNNAGLRYCKQCWSCQKSSKDNKNSTIPAVSQKRKKQDAEYSKLRKRYLEENPLCKVKVSGCSNTATDVHHTYSGDDRAVYYLIQSTWMPVCRNCHDWIHGNPAKARTMKWLK
jgi:hypothetical protein